MRLLFMTPTRFKSLGGLLGPMRSPHAVFFAISESLTSRGMVMHALCIIIVKAFGVGILFLVICILSRIIPPRYPQNIPAVPFWVTLLSLFRDIDQEEIYRRHIQKPLQTHGAIKIFFAGQWNLLVQRSGYLNEIFRNEDLYQKSGNQKKIPHSVLAEFLVVPKGDNVISSRGTTWRLYRDIITPGLQGHFDTGLVAANAEELCSSLLMRQNTVGNRGVLVQDLLQQLTIANVSQVLLQANHKPTKGNEPSLHQLQLAVKREIFKPIFMNFPVLDRFGRLIPCRVRARNMVEQFSAALERSVRHGQGSPQPANLGARLIAARDSGVLTEKQFRDNLKVLFVAGQENPQLLLISMLYLLAKHPNVQSRLRQEVDACNTQDPSKVAFSELPYLTSVIYESLRLLPPISQLINRRTSQDLVLGNQIYIPKGTYVGYNCYSTNRDPAVWGPTADEFRPERWGQSNTEILQCYRQRRARAEFVSFHGGSRACLGEKFALLEARVALFVLISRLSWLLDPEWPDRKTPAGPLYPRALRLVFTERK
ncbi:cytochrome P450 [Aspergillus pseudonomiae]|uniref:Cytochrome P450 n=1 Tax=Aspergillus pseudonomiae TaxID=1506151 RepID=A0A5N7DM00_9EURO|nr:cytochrome P450 [Aspergillus pseudonomiae]KAE8407481.1 cytochrome P450 [Aspergillus pseudonomiae]